MTEPQRKTVRQPTIVRSKKVADLVASRLRRMIADGELKEGDWLPTEAELVTDLGVSRPTLREAFRLLEADGLVQIRRGPPGGAQVTRPGPETAANLFGLILTLSGTTLLDVYEARMTIEPPAARAMAELGHNDGLEALSAEIELAARLVHDPAAFGAQTTRVHNTIVQQSGNHTLAAVVGMLSEITNRHVAVGVRETKRTPEEISENARRVVRAYQKLLDLIRSGRGADAEAFWRRHMRAALDYLLIDAAAAHDVVDVLG